MRIIAAGSAVLLLAGCPGPLVQIPPTPSQDKLPTITVSIIPSAGGAFSLVGGDGAAIDKVTEVTCPDHVPYCKIIVSSGTELTFTASAESPGGVSEVGIDLLDALGDGVLSRFIRGRDRAIAQEGKGPSSLGVVETNGFDGPGNVPLSVVVQQGMCIVIHARARNFNAMKSDVRIAAMSSTADDRELCPGKAVAPAMWSKNIEIVQRGCPGMEYVEGGLESGQFGVRTPIRTTPALWYEAECYYSWSLENVPAGNWHMTFWFSAGPATCRFRIPADAGSPFYLHAAPNGQTCIRATTADWRNDYP